MNLFEENTSGGPKILLKVGETSNVSELHWNSLAMPKSINFIYSEASEYRTFNKVMSLWI